MNLLDILQTTFIMLCFVAEREADPTKQKRLKILAQHMSCWLNHIRDLHL